ncbi:M14 family metallopeptidase [Neptunicella marina]|nr:M14 family metallocarboxypeptidase [Neptunicella marina]
MKPANYSIGTPGKPWEQTEKQQWKMQQTIKRSYQQEVINKLDSLKQQFNIEQYGSLPYDEQRYPLFIAKSKSWLQDRPVVLVTGGVHGYETSGVQGAIRFLESEAHRYLKQFNFVVAPCLSPWGYETINRWNPDAIDPNRHFVTESSAAEARLFIQMLQQHGWLKGQQSLIAHFDLHETTDTDNSEFRPALAARDGIALENWHIPDGFYVVADTAKPQLAFQQAVINEVEKVTHIAPADDSGCIIGSKVKARGVIYYDKSSLGLCGGLTDATYVTTTEVYPDSEHATDELCILAQVAAITGGLDFILNQQ